MPKRFKDISQNPKVTSIIRDALKEDIGLGDYSSLSCIESDKVSTAKLIFKDHGVAAGLSIAKQILLMNDRNCRFVFYKKDGNLVKKGDIGFEVKGNTQALLKSERLLLNLMQRLCGIATLTRHAVNLIKNYDTKLLDTRKTTPNLRILEKWAVTVGGAYNHRNGLYDMIMLKDNHVDVAGGIAPAIKKAKQYLLNHHLNLDIEVETRNLDEVQEAIKVLPIHRIMLDNFTPEMTREAVELIAGRCQTEASGGINLDNLLEYAMTGVDFISLGLLTHSVKSMDISFKIKL